MKMNNIEKLDRAVRSFQKVLQSGVKSFKVLQKFPTGSCKLTSMLVAKYLVISGLAVEKEIFLSANGMNEDNVSHAWLVVDNVIVDITAFQFDDSINEVIFNKDSEFHSRFKGATLYKYDSFIMNMAPDYEKVFSETLRNIVEALA